MLAPTQSFKVCEWIIKKKLFAGTSTKQHLSSESEGDLSDVDRIPDTDLEEDQFHDKKEEPGKAS